MENLSNIRRVKTHQIAAQVESRCWWVCDQVWNAKDDGATSQSRVNSGARILKDQTSGYVDAEKCGGFEVALGIGLAYFHILIGDAGDKCPGGQEVDRRINEQAWTC